MYNSKPVMQMLEKDELVVLKAQEVKLALKP